MKVSLNAKVKVELTIGGLMQLKSHCAEYNCETPTSYLNGDFQLWEIMEIFGKNIFNGTTILPFKNNEIDIQVETAEWKL